MKTNFIFLMIFFSLITFVSACSEISYTFPQGTQTEIKIPCISELNGICSADVQCQFTSVYTRNGQDAVKNQSMSYAFNYFNYTLNKTETENIGIYQAVVQCEGSSNASSTFCYEITESGFANTTQRTYSSLFLLFVLSSIFVISLIMLFKVANYIGKFAFYWICHIMFILILFVSWQIGVEVGLSGVALVGIFRILFLIFTISAFPMLILSLVWIFYIHTFNEHFQKLVDKGVSPEEAFNMTNKKRGGWFNGK